MKRYSYSYAVGIIGTVEAESADDARDAAREEGRAQIADGSWHEEIEVEEVGE